MKRLLMVLVVLAIVAGMSFAVDVSGSTTASVITNKDEHMVIAGQEWGVGIGILDIDVSGEITHTLLAKETFWEWEIGSSVTFCPNDQFTVGGAIGGEKDIPLGDISAFVDIRIENVGADVDFLFSAAEGADRFQGAEFSVYFDVGSLACRVGYMWTDNGEPDTNTPEALTGGGFYGTATISY